MPRQDRHDLEAWTDCAPGTLSELSHRLHRARRRKTLGRVGAPLLVIALVGVGMWSVNAPATPSEFTFGGVCCSEVQSKLQRYVGGGLEQDERRAVGIHLERCPLCQKKKKAMQGQTTRHHNPRKKACGTSQSDSGGRDAVCFSDEVATLTLLKVEGNRVQRGIEAPTSIGVHRQEVWARIRSETDSPGGDEAEHGRAVA